MNVLLRREVIVTRVAGRPEAEHFLDLELAAL
jgi:hypothetical protein